MTVTLHSDPARDQDLGRLCAEVATAAHQGRAWVEDVKGNSAQVAAEAASLIDRLRRAEMASRKLERAALRRMCVGVFGPSQSGKSYLVSALARRPPTPLKADFAGVLKDFLVDINPPGDRESTGLVTRFTTQRDGVPESHPVAVRLLTETDLVKTLANSFLSDFDRDNLEFEPPGADAARALIGELMPKAGSAKSSAHLDAFAIYDLQDYFQRLYANPTRYLETSGYWDAAAKLAPSLSLNDRAKLFSILWGGIEPLTQLYLRLVTALEALNFAATAQLGMEALVPRTASIIDVQTLDRLGTPEDEKDLVEARTPAGQVVKLPRALLTALVAELRIVIPEKPWDFFDTTDLLDFPGARSRLRLRALSELVPKPGAHNPIRELFLRGKVAYLFQRYADERELTGMLLCIGPGPQEVKDLGPMVLDWVRSTHGDTPDGRRGQKTALFLVLTKFDREFDEKQGEDEQARRGRWDRRLGTSLVELFGKDLWPENWDGKPFRNTFWLRNPGIKQPGLMDYDEVAAQKGEQVEARVAPGAVARLGELKSYFIESEGVRAHFADPAKSWDAAFTLNDGGVGHLVAAITDVCDPDLKRVQVAKRIAEQGAKVRAALDRFHAAEAGDLRERKLALARSAVGGLRECVAAGRFGDFQATLQIGEDDVRELYLKVATLAPEEGDSAPRPAPGGAVDDIFADLGLESAPAAASNGSGAASDRSARFAAETIELWTRDLRRMGENDGVLARLKVDPKVLGDIVSELVSGAERLGLRDRIATTARREGQFANAKWEDLAGKQALIATTLVNGFVDWLGYADRPLDQRPGLPANAPTRRVFQPMPPVDGLPILGDRREPLEKQVYGDWLRALMALYEDNAGFTGGREISPQQNAALGAVLAQLAIEDGLQRIVPGGVA